MGCKACSAWFSSSKKTELCSACERAMERLGFKDVEYSRLRKLMQADREGRCVVLPCKVGDIVYDCDFGMVNEWKIVGFSVGKVGLGMNGLYSDDCEIVFYAESTERQAQMEFPQSNIGDDVFLTREEAERNLEE